LSIFQEHVEALWERLNSLNGFLFLLRSQLYDFRAMYRHALEQRGIGFDRVHGGTALPVRDLAQEGCPDLIPSGRFTVQGEGYLELVDRLLERESIWTIGQGYEAFGTFLNDVGGTYLRSFSEKVSAEEFAGFKELSLARGLPDDLSVLWRELFKNKHRSAEKALKAIRSWSPSLGAVEACNNRDLDLRVWLFVLAEVRHASVHSNSKVKNTTTSSWPRGAVDILERRFKAKADSGSHDLHCGFEAAEEALSILGDYGYLIFNSLSSTCGESSKIIGTAQPGASSGRLAPHA
jgi:hypothetical protein